MLACILKVGEIESQGILIVGQLQLLSPSQTDIEQAVLLLLNGYTVDVDVGDAWHECGCHLRNVVRIYDDYAVVGAKGEPSVV